jgi:glycosyltransferase involved in cell wall biosynthesis
MKVLVISSKYQPEYSGSGLRAHNTYIRLKKNYNINYDILSNSIIFKGNKKYIYDGVEIIRISPPFKVPQNKSLLRSTLIILGIFWEVFYSWKFIQKKIDNYDLLHTFGNTNTIGFLSWYFAKKNKPVIRELCNDMNNPLYPIQVQKYMKPIFKKKNTLVVAISKKLEILAKNFEMKNVWLRPNPIDQNKFFVDFKNKYFLRSKITKFNQDDIVLNLVANYIDRKNQLFALEVLNMLPKKFKLLLAGPLKDEGAKYFKNIKKKIDDLKLHDRVDLQIGFINNFDEYLKCSDIFLFPSLAEGLGTPILESQLCGIPVISNNLKNITDQVIKNGVGGYYLELEIVEWAKAIQEAIKIPQEILIDNAKYMESLCSSKIIDDEYNKKINELIINES